VHSTRSHKWWSYKLLVHGRWFSSGTPASSTTKTGRHNIAEILLKMAWNTKIQSWNPKVAWYVSFKRYRIYVPQMTIIAIVTNMRNIRLLCTETAVFVQFQIGISGISRTTQIILQRTGYLVRNLQFSIGICGI
jgi:hypothetical protein